MDSTIISCFDGCSRSTSGAHLRRCGRICGNNSTFSYTIQSSRKYEGKYRSNHCHGYVKTDLGCSEICFLCEDNHLTLPTAKAGGFLLLPLLHWQTPYGTAMSYTVSTSYIYTVPVCPTVQFLSLCRLHLQSFFRILILAFVSRS